jgi:hypothetical protein
LYPAYGKKSKTGDNQKWTGLCHLIAHLGILTTVRMIAAAMDLLVQKGSSKRRRPSSNSAYQDNKSATTAMKITPETAALSGSSSPASVGKTVLASSPNQGMTSKEPKTPGTTSDSPANPHSRQSHKRLATLAEKVQKGKLHRVEERPTSPSQQGQVENAATTTAQTVSTKPTLPLQNDPLSAPTNIKMPQDCPFDPIKLIQRRRNLYQYVLIELYYLERAQRQPHVPKTSKFLNIGFQWRDAPELEIVLVKFFQSFYMTIGSVRSKLLTKILKQVVVVAEEHGYVFDPEHHQDAEDKPLRNRLRCYYNTLFQSSRRRFNKDSSKPGSSEYRGLQECVFSICQSLLAQYPQQDEREKQISMESLMSQNWDPDLLENRLQTILLKAFKQGQENTVKSIEKSSGKDPTVISSETFRVASVNATQKERGKASKRSSNGDGKAGASDVHPLKNPDTLTVPSKNFQWFKLPLVGQAQPVASTNVHESLAANAVPTDDPSDTTWTKFPVEESAAWRAWNRYNEVYSESKPPTEELNAPDQDLFFQTETFATLVRMRLASGLVASALQLCHRRLNGIYRAVQKAMHQNETLHVVVWRDQMATLWCLYAHVWLEIGEMLSPVNPDDHSETPNVFKNAAGIILSAATTCPIVGNHGWLSIALARLEGSKHEAKYVSKGLDILWDGLDRAHVRAVKPRVKLHNFSKSIWRSFRIPSTVTWKISALKQDPLVLEKLRRSFQTVVNLPGRIALQSYAMVDHASTRMLADEFNRWNDLLVRSHFTGPDDVLMSSPNSASSSSLALLDWMLPLINRSLLPADVEMEYRYTAAEPLSDATLFKEQGKDTDKEEKGESSGKVGNGERDANEKKGKDVEKEAKGETDEKETPGDTCIKTVPTDTLSFGKDDKDKVGLSETAATRAPKVSEKSTAAPPPSSSGQQETLSILPSALVSSREADVVSPEKSATANPQAVWKKAPPSSSPPPPWQTSDCEEDRLVEDPDDDKFHTPTLSLDTVKNTATVVTSGESRKSPLRNRPAEADPSSLTVCTEIEQACPHCQIFVPPQCMHSHRQVCGR